MRSFTRGGVQPSSEAKFQLASAMFQPASAVPCARIWHTSAFGTYPGGVAVRRAPEPGPSRGDRGVLFVLFTHPFAVPLQDRGLRHPQLQSSRSQIAGSSLSCYRVVQVDVRAPFDKGRLAVRRHVCNIPQICGGMLINKIVVLKIFDELCG
jgi:hypothetical protein